MTYEQAKRQLEIKEPEYFPFYKGYNTNYAAIIKESYNCKIKDDYKIEIGYHDGPNVVILDYDLIPESVTKEVKVLDIDENIKREFDNDNEKLNYSKKATYQSEGIFTESTMKYKKLTGGISVFESLLEGSGTAGAFFKIKNNDDIYLLSNHHVLAGDSNHIGDKIVHPSPPDTIYPDTIGEVIWGEYKKSELLDAAIARICQKYSVDVGSFTRCKSIIFSGLGIPRKGRFVRKCGKKTGLTSGLIRSTNCTVNVLDDKDNSTQIYRNQLLITDLTRPGDSGSILVNEKNEAVGLLFAGNNSTVSFANNINIVFERIKHKHPKFIFNKFI